MYVIIFLQVLLQEKLLAQEVSFKASCTATLSELQDEIAALDDALKLSGIDAAREQISGQPHTNTHTHIIFRFKRYLICVHCYMNDTYAVYILGIYYSFLV